MTYNGWTNYATWRVNLEICDDAIQSLIQDIPYGGMQFDDIPSLRDYLEELVDDVITQFGALEEGFSVDCARAFVNDVNYTEIAEAAVKDYPNLLESSDEEEEEEEDEDEE